MMYKKKKFTYCTFIQSEHENLSPDITFCIIITMIIDYLCKIWTFFKSGLSGRNLDVWLSYLKTEH
jgi:hypothetical protein